MRIATLALMLITVMPVAHAATFYACPNAGGTGDQVDRGFYVTNYPGTTLDTVTLSYQGGSGDGAYTVSLTPRLSVYGGTIVGATQTKVVNIVGSTFVNTTFNFGNAPVPPGSTVTFTQILVSGPVVMNPVLYYDVGSGTCTDVTQTNGTTPPLDSFRRNSVGLAITGALTAAASAIPTLSQYALLLLASLLAFAGIAYARRRR